jgi:oligoendopeptidase F
MNEIIDRKHTPLEFQWHLEDMYKNQQAWDEDFQSAKQFVQMISGFEGQLHQASAIKKCFELEDRLAMMTEKLYVYANMKHHEDTALPEYQALSDKSKKLSVDVSESLSFISPEILSLSEHQLAELLNNPELSFYKKTLEEMIKQKPHTLSKDQEALLAQAGNIASAPNTIFGMLNNADLTFPTIKNDQGKEVELTHGNYIQFLESRDPEVRKNAFQSMYATYAKQKNTLAAILSANINKNIFYSKARKFSSSLEMSLFSDNIKKEVYTNLIDTVHDSLPLMHRYLQLRKKLLKVEELHMYDLFTPLVEEFKMDISYVQAKQMIKESLAPLGEDYIRILDEGFNQHWIDVYENKNKRSGAYSWGAYGTHPYVLLNHKDNLNSMFTLTHEMGHAIHSHLSDQNQAYRYAQYTIFLAEVASTLNEALLMDYLLKRVNDPKEKLYLLTYYADQFRTTVFRQTMFAEFEMMIHAHAENGESLTPQAFSDIYYTLNKQYYGDIEIDQDIEMEWARIPHFYNSFYVYKYATGFSAATSFAKQILEQGKPAVDRYLGFLKSGGSEYSLEILNRAGVDMSSPEPIRQAMSVFQSLIDDMEKLSLE